MWRPESGLMVGRLAGWGAWLPKGLKRSEHLVLRLGQAQCQLWQSHGHGQSLTLRLLANRAVNHIAHDQHAQLAQEVRQLLQEALPADSAAFRLQVLADSKWLPLTLLQTGRAPLSASQVQALAQHRFKEVFGDQALHWTIESNYVSGDTHTLAFACPAALLTNLRQALTSDALGSPTSSTAAGPLTSSSERLVRLESLQPTFAWIWNHAPRLGSDPCYLVLAEHDRSVMAWIHKGRIKALQAAAPFMHCATDLAEHLPIQALRCGVTDQTTRAWGVALEGASQLTEVAPSNPDVRWRSFAAEPLTQKASA